MSLFQRQNQSGKTIFVVDDEVQLLELAKLVFEDIGYEVRTFEDPEEALKEYRKNCPALVVTDYWMPRMSGMDLIRECRRLNPAQKTILISGTVDGQVFANAVIQPDQFVAKPYDPQALKNMVVKMLEGAQQ